MSTTATRSEGATTDARVSKVDMKLEVITIPVSDVDRAKEFYRGARLAAGRHAARLGRGPIHAARLRVFGPIRHEPQAAPVRPEPFLIVSDIQAARDELARRGVEVSEVFHFGPPTAGWAARRPITQLRLVRHVQRSGRQQLAAAGDHDAAARAGSTPPRRRSVRRAIWRARCGGRRRPTASTRSAPGSETRTGPTGTPRTWWRNRRAASCLCEGAWCGPADGGCERVA